MQVSAHYDTIRAVEWIGGGIKLLDQRLLPARCEYVECGDVASAAQAIVTMTVRGAPAIGICAAYAVVLAAHARYKASADTWRQDIEADLKLLAQTRPTAVNLFWALTRMRQKIAVTQGQPDAELLAEAQAIHAEDLAANYYMGDQGAALLEPDSKVLTHCNTGSLATGGYGTALGVIRSAYAAGKIAHVYAGETRPWLQGARLTTWELMREGIPVTLIADGAAAHLMSTGTLHWVIVGADRIAANGDMANKIGTYSLAVSARYHGVKFMAVAPSSSVDLGIGSGQDIVIEMRAPEEVLSLNGQTIAASGAQAWNPTFDVTPAGLIDVLVTEKGVVTQPNAEKIASMMHSSSA